MPTSFRQAGETRGFVTSTERFYGLHGVGVRVCSRHPKLIERAHLFLEHFGLTEAADTAECLVFDLVGDRSPDPPDDGRWLDIPGCGLSVLDRDDDVEVRGGKAAIRFVPSSGKATLTLEFGDQAGGGLNINLLSFALLSLLRTQGLFPLHAACVSRNGRGLLIVADSGGGKTTLASRLLMSGWSYLSDDSVLLRPTDDGVEALALRRDLFVLPGSSELAEDADAETWRDTNKLRVDVRRRFPDRIVDGCPVDAVLFPEIVPRRSSALSPCSPEDALRLLTHQSLVAELDRSRVRQHLESLARLVNTTRCYVLEACSDLIEDPDRADCLLAPLCDHGQAAEGM